MPSLKGEFSSINHDTSRPINLDMTAATGSSPSVGDHLLNHAMSWGRRGRTISSQLASVGFDSDECKEVAEKLTELAERYTS